MFICDSSVCIVLYIFCTNLVKNKRNKKIMLLSIWCLIDKDIMANMTIPVIYENTVCSVNNATATRRPNIFCSMFLLFSLFREQIQLYGFLQVMEIVAYVSVLCSLNSDLPKIHTFLSFY